MKKRVCNWVFSVVAIAWSQSVLADLVVEGWVRESVPGASVGAAYLTIGNQGAEDVTLTSVSSTSSRSVMIHTTRLIDGQARMRHLNSVEVAKGQVLTMEPGGMHLMLMGVESLKVGDEVLFTLSFSSGEEITVELPVHKT